MNKILVLLVAAVCSMTSFAQEKKEEDEKPIPIAQSFVTSHQGTFGGALLKYNPNIPPTFLAQKSMPLSRAA